MAMTWAEVTELKTMLGLKHIILPEDTKYELTQQH